MEKIHPPTAPLVQLTRRTNITGKQLSWDQMILLTPEVSSSWTSISQLITHSSQLRSTSPQEFTTQISTLTVQFAWIFSRINGHQHSPSPRFSCPSPPCWLTPTQMILLFQRLLTSTRPIKQSMRPPPESGLENTLCESIKTVLYGPTKHANLLIIWTHHEYPDTIFSDSLKPWRLGIFLSKSWSSFIFRESFHISAPFHTSLLSKYLLELLRYVLDIYLILYFHKKVKEYSYA